MSVSFCLPHPVAVSAFMICRDLCACTEMLWICVLYVSFGSIFWKIGFGRYHGLQCQKRLTDPGRLVLCIDPCLYYSQCRYEFL